MKAYGPFFPMLDANAEAASEAIELLQGTSASAMPSIDRVTSLTVDALSVTAEEFLKYWEASHGEVCKAPINDLVIERGVRLQANLTAVLAAVDQLEGETATASELRTSRENLQKVLQIVESLEVLRKLRFSK